jgi:hypothetical protein
MPPIFSRLFSRDNANSKDTLPLYRYEGFAEDSRIVLRDRPDPELDPAIFGDAGLAIDHRALKLGAAADRFHDARKFHQHPVARRLDGTTGMLGDLRIGLEGLPGKPVSLRG